MTAQGSAEVLSPGDVTRLHALYAASPGLDPAPLQHPRLVQQLLAGGALRGGHWRCPHGSHGRGFRVWCDLSGPRARLGARAWCRTCEDGRRWQAARVRDGSGRVGMGGRQALEEHPGGGGRVLGLLLVRRAARRSVGLTWGTWGVWGLGASTEV